MASGEKSTAKKNPHGKKKVQLRDLPKSKKELSKEECERLKGGVPSMLRR